MLGVDEQERIISEEMQKFNDLATMPTFGRGAVEQAEGQNLLANADSAPEAPSEAIGKVRTIGSQTFILRDGIWTDTRYDPNILETTKIEFLSEQYFSIARSQPQLARAFALGPQVIVLLGDTTYEIITDGSATYKTPSQEDYQETPTVEIQGQVEVESNPSKSTSASLLPCWGGLLITMLPMIAGGDC